MIIIVWNLIDFHVVDVLPKGDKFNAHHYVSAILQFLTDWPVAEIRAIDRNFFIHAPNARSHTVKVSLPFVEQNGMKMISHPPYSTDLASLDFFLFDYIKGFSLVTLSNQSMTFY
jgi:hypothetical protein